MEKRQVKLSSLLKLTINKAPQSRLGILFTLLSVFVLFPCIIMLTISLKEPYEKYDFDAIAQNGTALQATVMDVDVLTNVSVNNEHPRIVSYAYVMNGVEKQDKFSTMDIEDIANLKAGDKIAIKEYKGESAIQNLEPFSFPAELFLTLPVIFFIIGAIFTLMGLLPALRDFNLYKTGRVKEATILSMAHNSGMRVSGVGKSISVYYDYIGNGGRKIFGESRVYDFSILSTHKVGSPIKIFVSEDESRSCVIPTSEIVKNNWRV